MPQEARLSSRVGPSLDLRLFGGFEMAEAAGRIELSADAERVLASGALKQSPWLARGRYRRAIKADERTITPSPNVDAPRVVDTARRQEVARGICAVSQRKHPAASDG